jgi:murein L,D-transpeptidase YcbB/YkuD
MIDSLTAELQSLEVQAGITSSPSASSYLFTTNLELYDTGAEVNALQDYLVQQDKGSAATKLKAHGTTSFFGILTFNALVEFQKSVGIIPDSGFFGPITRAWVNSH